MSEPIHTPEQLLAETDRLLDRIAEEADLHAVVVVSQEADDQYHSRGLGSLQVHLQAVCALLGDWLQELPWHERQAVTMRVVTYLQSRSVETADEPDTSSEHLPS